VFVGDSQARQLDENIESLQNLQSNLLEHGVDVRTMPLIMQYNKQDLPPELILTHAELDDALNFRSGAELPGRRAARQRRVRDVESRLGVSPQEARDGEPGA